MKVEVRQGEPLETGADLTVVGLYDGEALAGAIAEAPGAGDAKGRFEKGLLLHPDRGSRVLVLGLGKREEADAERLRVAAALAAKEAARLEAGSLAWALPEIGEESAAVEALVTGTILGSYRFERFKAADPDEPSPARIETLTLLAPVAVAA